MPVGSGCLFVYRKYVFLGSGVPVVVIGGRSGSAGMCTSGYTDTGLLCGDYKCFAPLPFHFRWLDWNHVINFFYGSGSFSIIYDYSLWRLGFMSAPILSKFHGSGCTYIFYSASRDRTFFFPLLCSFPQSFRENPAQCCWLSFFWSHFLFMFYAPIHLCCALAVANWHKECWNGHPRAKPTVQIRSKLIPFLEISENAVTLIEKDESSYKRVLRHKPPHPDLAC